MALSVSADFVRWFRSAAPYLHAFGGRTFVIAFGGEVVADARFLALIHDLNLLASLDIKLVLVHGARPQIDARLAGMAAAVVLAWRRAPLIVVIVAGAAVTAVVRHLSGTV